MTAPDTQQWLELVADFEAEPGRQLKAFAKEHGVDASEFLGWLKRVRIEGAAAEVMDVTEPEGLDDILVAAAVLHDGLTISRVAKAVGVRHDVARKWLVWLVEEERLVKTGKTRGQRFSVPKR